MRLLYVLATVAMTVSSSQAAPLTRAEFATRMAKLKPGMTADQVEQALGRPDDVRTERDPGGITAARTTEVWRYGTRGHLAFATLGTVHIQADRKVQYVFGGKGTAITGIAEPELRRLLELVDGVPSYNGTLEPLRLIRAVNALVPLGKDRALAVVDEYLRVSSDLDDDGREGVFLLMRALFDVPAGGMPPMMVGAPSLAPPKDPALLPRFPLVIVDDVPLKLVGGYMLGGHPQQPEDDVKAFRKPGAVIRTKPLAPTPRALDAIDMYVAGPLAAAIPVDDHLRVALYDQALRFFGTVYRPAAMTIDTWFPWGNDVANRWKQIRLGVAALGAKWDAKAVQLVLANGTTLAAVPGPSPRVWWDLGLAGAASSRVTLERKSDTLVAIEVRLELAAGAKVAADTLRVIDPKTNKEIATIEISAIAPAASTSSSVSGSRLQLTRGAAIRLELRSGARSPTLTP